VGLMQPDCMVTYCGPASILVTRVARAQREYYSTAKASNIRRLFGSDLRVNGGAG
jgi:hypothetical protein